MKYIFAYNHKNKYYGEGVFTSLDEALQGIEQQDVLARSYQIWEYPSGRMFDVVDDDETELTPDDYRLKYTPLDWVILKYFATNKKTVDDTYRSLTD